MIRIAGLGINVVDYYKNDKFCYFGGNEYNIVNFVKQLNGDTAYIGVFSPDKAGKLLRENLEKQNIDISHSKIEEGSCGYAVVKIIDGERFFESWNHSGVADCHPIQITNELISFLLRYDITCISSYSRLTLKKIEKLHINKVRLSYDFSDTFTDDDIKYICPLVDISFFSMNKIKQMEEVKEFLKKAFIAGSNTVVATLGEKGAIAYDGSIFYFQNSQKVNCIDTMGAGDSFIAAFLLEYLKNRDIYSAMKAGTQFAAKQVTIRGSLGTGFPVTPDKFKDYITQMSV